MPTMRVRKRHCAECPLRGDWTPETITELLEGWPDTHFTPPELICTHEMEAGEPEDRWRICRGFHENALRLGLR